MIWWALMITYPHPQPLIYTKRMKSSTINLTMAENSTNLFLVIKGFDIGQILHKTVSLRGVNFDPQWSSWKSLLIPKQRHRLPAICQQVQNDIKNQNALFPLHFAHKMQFLVKSTVCLLTNTLAVWILCKIEWLSLYILMCVLFPLSILQKSWYRDILWTQTGWELKRDKRVCGIDREAIPWRRGALHGCDC